MIVRMPASWRMNRPARPQVKVTVGGKAPSQVGLDALLDFRMEVTLDGETLSAAEIKRLLAQSDGLAFIRGKWVEVDRERLTPTLEHSGRSSAAPPRRACRSARPCGCSPAPDIARPMREPQAATSGLERRRAGPWLARDAGRAAHPRRAARVDPGPALHGTLRPYQQAGVQWLYLLTRLGLGACLADDMGLGKTIQVLSLLLVLEAPDRERSASRACWWRRPRCSPTGRRKSSASRRACAFVIAHPSAIRPRS